MNESNRPTRKPSQHAEIIECEAVPLETARTRRPVVERRSFNLIWLIPVAIVLFLMFKVIAVFLIAILVLFALPKLLPGGFSAVMKALIPKDRNRRP